ncbi:MAG: sensor histidine kinase [Methanoregula sp.]
MSCYELTKQVINPSISLWESHIITIIFTSVMAAVIVFFPLRAAWQQREKAQVAEKELAETNRKLTLMNGITHHDMLNQLSAVSSYLSLSGERSNDLTVKKYLLKAEQGVDIIISQIQYAKDYQQIGVQSPQWQNLLMTLQYARQPLRLPDLEIDAESKMTEIFADPMLEKVFYNLFDNSLRYGDPKTSIKVYCRQEPDRLLIIYEDNGAGIPATDKDRIFNRGYGKNTGLGLFMIREILAITGISIQEDGEPGKGVRFILSVPKDRYRVSPG